MYCVTQYLFVDVLREEEAVRQSINDRINVSLINAPQAGKHP